MKKIKKKKKEVDSGSERGRREAEETEGEWNKHKEINKGRAKKSISIST